MGKLFVLEHYCIEFEHVVNKGKYIKCWKSDNYDYGIGLANAILKII